MNSAECGSTRAHGFWQRCLPLLLGLSLLLWRTPARAEVSAQLVTGGEQVEAGKPIAVQLSVSSDEGAPESPRLDVPGNWNTRGPSVSRRYSTSISGFSATTKRELTATWNVTTNSVGKHTIGPARAVVDGKTVVSNTVTLDVVPPGTLKAPPPPPQRKGSLLDDDDFFKGFPGFGRSPLDDLFGPMRADVAPQAPPEYQLEQARDGLAFLNATITPTIAVVGQQVTLRIVAYGAAGRFRENDPREPRRADFFSIPMMDPQNPERMYTTRIGSSDYLAVKVREYALFPLKAGKLEIGPMKMQFYGSNYISRTTSTPVERESQTLVLDVQEPPAEQRPLDYQVGDVGKYSLAATVTPRSIGQGDSFSVVAVLEGEGNPPQTLRVPEQSGLEWLQPTLTEQLRVNARRRVEGKRTFTYIVKATRAGTLDVGELRLPYFEPSSGSYEVARVNLGKVTVSAAAPAVASPNASAASLDQSNHATDELSLTELASARPKLSPYEPKDEAWARSPWLWAVTLTTPALAFALQPLRTRLSSFATRRKQDRTSLRNQVQQQLNQARELAKAGDSSGALSALERAIFWALEDATGVKARAILQSELHATLVESGMSSAQAMETTEVLREVESYRFGGAQGGLEGLTRRADKLVSSFGSRKEAA